MPHQLIKKMAQDAISASAPLRLIEAIVVEEPPDLKVRLKSNAKLILPKEILIVAEHLTRHTRMVNIISESVESSMSAAGEGPHTHKIRTVELKEAEAEFIDELKKGDKVMTAAIQGGQFFYIMDRYKQYGRDD